MRPSKLAKVKWVNHSYPQNQPWKLFEKLIFGSFASKLTKIKFLKEIQALTNFSFNFCCQYTVRNKNTHLPAFETCVFRVCLRNHLRYKKVSYFYLHPCQKSFQIKNNFWSPVTKSAEIFKNDVLPEKSNLLEKICHFEKFKNFFSWI